MPANLTPAYREAEERFRQATTPEEKIECLEEMLAVIPKHKGTEKLQADIKRRL
ncbi:MAG TPA: GTP-binding protein HSR1, partial [Armatimonadota bacterium]|nr:GTP-binding protein HSR1 [Armatimonadota bacterium]